MEVFDALEELDVAADHKAFFSLATPGTAFEIVAPVSGSHPEQPRDEIEQPIGSDIGGKPELFPHSAPLFGPRLRRRFLVFAAVRTNGSRQGAAQVVPI